MLLIETLAAPRIGRLALLASLLILSALHQLILLAVGHPFAGHELTQLHAAVSVPAALLGWMLAVKRAHDLDHSAWWLATLSGIYIALIAFLALGGTATIIAPALGLDPRLFANVRGMFSLGLRLKLAVTAASVAAFWPVLIKLLFYAGTPNTNRYGVPPGLRARLMRTPDHHHLMPEPSAEPIHGMPTARAGHARQNKAHPSKTPPAFGRRH